MTHTILLVDDDPVQRALVSGLLERKAGFRVVAVDGGPAALAAVEKDGDGVIRLAIVDHFMPGMDGLELMAVLRRRRPGLPVIMLTSSESADIAVRAMKMGARDFLTKPPEIERLRVSIGNALRISALESEVTRLKRKDEGAARFGDLIGCAGGLAETVRIGRKAAASDIPLLLTGETGTGKEIFARAVHGEGRRAGAPFVAVNCGALPENLVESILFGHEKGAFTGAVAKADGKFREANGGTLFLDEVGELPPEAQVKLLRVLQQKEVSPVGAARSVPVDVRIISATHRDLGADVAAGRFREDLYFRLNVLSIRMPPLRARREDIPLLIAHFLERFSAAESRPLMAAAPEVVHVLTRLPWPGNVRELENVIHRALVLADTDILTAADFALAEAAARPRGAGEPESGTTPSILGPDGRIKPLEQIEQEIMRFALETAGRNVTRAARMLGMAKSTFYKKMK